MAKAAAGVIRSSHCEALAGRMDATPRMYGSTIATMTVVTAAALRRNRAPTASARTAATAISAAVPAITRTSVSHDTGNTYELWRAIWAPKLTAATAATSPATKVTEPITIALAARTRPRR